MLHSEMGFEPPLAHERRFSGVQSGAVPVAGQGTPGTRALACTLKLQSKLHWALNPHNS
jgi:hypothetical protein